MKFGLASSLLLLPLLIATGLRQDLWLAQGYEDWSRVEPYSYWASRILALGILIWGWRRLRRA